MDFVRCWVLQIKWESINLCVVKLNVDWKKRLSAFTTQTFLKGNGLKIYSCVKFSLLTRAYWWNNCTRSSNLVYRNTLIGTQEVLSVTSEYCYFHRKVNCNETLQRIGYWPWNWTTAYVGYRYLSKWRILAPRLLNKEKLLCEALVESSLFLRNLPAKFTEITFSEVFLSVMLSSFYSPLMT